jgi:tetratricopeptide (TPR) repeat protein
MRKFLIPVVSLLTAALVPLAAQKQPQVKSQKEGEAVTAIFQTQDPDARIAAVETLLSKFADTEFKPLALYIATISAQQKNDFEKTMLYAERALEADPKSFATMLIMASGIAQRTREHDLDREEKLGRAEKLANDAGELIKTAPKMNPQLTDEQWEAAKKDFMGQRHEALGMIAVARKKYDAAIAEFKSAVAANGDPATMVRLGQAYTNSGKPDEAIAVLDQVIGNSDVPVEIKQVAQAEKTRAIQAKGAKK